jgi:thioredoxin 1
MNLKDIVITSLIALAAIYVIYRIPQPYGLGALGIILLAVAFGFIFKKHQPEILSWGKTLSLGVLGAAAYFIYLGESQKSKFDQPTAVTFSDKSYEEALVLSKTTNKPVFIDFYATWCGTCVYFSKNILTVPEVGAAMNASFINLKYDAEKGAGRQLAKKYGVVAYPTLIVVDSSGNLVEELSRNSVPTAEQMVIYAQKYLR